MLTSESRVEIFILQLSWSAFHRRSLLCCPVAVSALSLPTIRAGSQEQHCWVWAGVCVAGHLCTAGWSAPSLPPHPKCHQHPAPAPQLCQPEMSPDIAPCVRGQRALCCSSTANSHLHVCWAWTKQSISPVLDEEIKCKFWNCMRGRSLATAPQGTRRKQMAC